MNSSGHPLFLIAGATLGDRNDALHQLFVALAIGGPLALIAMSAAGWLMVGGALRPIERLRQEAQAVSASEPDRRLPVPDTGDELARLGTTLNAMLGAMPSYDKRARRAGVRITLDVQPGTVWVDPTRVRQALENLLENALRYAGPGDVITLRSERTGDGVRIRVEDTGPGFPQDMLETAFEPFVSSGADVDGNGSSPGVGLGLAIVRAVAEAHGGTATAENLATRGARVTLLLRTRSCPL